MRNLGGAADGAGAANVSREAAGGDDMLHASIVQFYREGNSIAATAKRFGMSDWTTRRLIKQLVKDRRPRPGDNSGNMDRGGVPLPVKVSLPYLKFLDPAYFLPHERGYRADG